jgi:uncharacterized membrane protein YdbT with pleckstrin-like domain
MADEIIKYAPLGGKTLSIFILKRSAIIFLPVILLAVIIAARSYLPINYVLYANLAIIAIVVILMIVAFFIFLFGWLEYIRYKIFIDQESIKINRGVISEEQIGIPFRRIRQAEIRRSIIDQLIGISDLTLVILGEDDGGGSSKELEIILPALDKNIAIKIQDLVLERAQVEDVNMRTNKII